MISKSPDLDQSKFVSIILDDKVHATCTLIKLSSDKNISRGTGLEALQRVWLGLGYRDICEIATQFHLVNVKKNHMIFCRRSLFLSRDICHI